jgi:hypothetical protein
MKFVFIAKHRNIWPVAWLCDALGVSRSGFHAWLNRSPSARSRSDEVVGQRVKASFVASNRTYGGTACLARPACRRRQLWPASDRTVDALAGSAGKATPTAIAEGRR